MKILKSNEKSYLKTSMSNTQLLIPAAGQPPDLSKNFEIKKIDKFIAKNYPIALLKINDKSILEMNIENARLNNLEKIKIVTGYKSDLFSKYKNVKNLKIINNVNFKRTSQMDSIAIGLDPNLNSIVIFQIFFLKRYCSKTYIKKL